MRSRSPRKRGNAGWIARTPTWNDAALLYAWLDLPTLEGSEIEQCCQYYDRKGIFRRVRFVMTDGWVHQADRRADGSFSVRGSWKFTACIRPGAAA